MTRQAAETSISGVKLTTVAQLKIVKIAGRTLKMGVRTAKERGRAK